MENNCLVFYHGNDWDWVPSRQRYLMEALSRYVPVIYLDGGRNPGRRVTYRQVAENVLVIRGVASLMLGLRSRGLERLNLLVGYLHFKWLRRKYCHIYFWDMENWLRPYRFIPHDVLIYDSIDPVFNRDEQVVKDFEERELEILGLAHKVFASADSLAAFCKLHHSNVTLLNNACAPSEYSPDLLEKSPQPDWWPKGKLPLAAYLGTIDQRFDFSCVWQAVRDHPSVQFIFAGSVIPALVSRVNELGAQPNVLCPGRISVSEGRYLLSHCDIGLIPFTSGEMNDAINPVKMYAYALLGRPIVGTATRELKTRPEVVVTGDSPADFSVAIDVALEKASNINTSISLKKFALENTWEIRAAQAWEEIKHL